MALTNFAALTTEQKTVWSMDLWKMARNYSFIDKFLGKDSNSLIQHVTELTKSESGARAVITLLADLEGDGIAGDRTLEGNEESMVQYDQVIQIDQLRHGNRSKGSMAEQRSIVNFRKQSRDKLAYWLGDRMDQMAFLTLAGISYAYNPNGSVRVGSTLSQLEFAADVTAPTYARNARWHASHGLQLQNAAGTGAVADADLTAADTPTWNLMLELKTYARNQYMRGVRSTDGDDTYHAFLAPDAMLALKQDPVYRDNLRYAQTRGGSNELFTGGSVKIDGITLHEFRHVPTNLGAATKFGTNGDLNGSRILFCGAQALGMADLGKATWVEKEFDYDNQPGISTAKKLGFKKPVFTSQYASNTAQDFGVITCKVTH